MAPDELQALRALRDCGVIRAHRYHPAFYRMELEGLVDARPARPAPGHYAKADFRLRIAGQIAARNWLGNGA